MKLLDKPVRTKNLQKNALEALLYPSTPPCKSINNLTYDYDKGMHVSINNHASYWEDLVRQYKKQYQSIILALTGKKISRDDIKQHRGIPIRNTIMSRIYYKIPIMVAGIHDYKEQDANGYGSRRNYEYQHTHLFLYNIQHYLPDTPLKQADRINKIEKHLLRYTNTKKRKKDTIRITPVGTGKYSYTDDIQPNNFYEYLHLPDTEPDKNTLINYISYNRHKPEVNYPLYCTYYSPNHL